MIELARAMYICNTLQEVTRRAAAAAVNANFTVGDALREARVKAIFREDPGMLAFAAPIYRCTHPNRLFVYRAQREYFTDRTSHCDAVQPGRKQEELRG